MKLQYQMSNGNWTDTKDRTEEFLLRCENFNGLDANGKIVPIFRAVQPLTRQEVLGALTAGRELRNDKNDWYSNCRDGEAVERIAEARRAAAPSVKMANCSCGHITPSISVMSTSRGSSCPDCYDRMSN